MPCKDDPAAWVERAACDNPGHTFLRTPQGRIVSYAALRRHSGKFAAALAALQVQPGDRVAVQVDKSVDAVFLYVACLRMGAVFVPINVANTANEVDYLLHDCRPRVAVIRPADRALIEPSALRASACLATLGADGTGSLPDLANELADEFAERTLDPAALAAIVYTSGTTGRSKGAMLTRANLFSNATVLAETWRFDSTDVLLHTLPLFHVHGLFVAINTVLASRSALTLLPRFDAESTLEHLPQTSVYMGVPTHYTRLLQNSALNQVSTSRVRLFVSGSAPLLPETHREFLARTGHVILERYGMTETLINTSNPYIGPRIPGSVGPSLRGTELRVTHPGLDAEAAQDSIGMLQVKGPSVFAGYWQEEAKTLAAFAPDGWFKTGDLGRIDSEGYVYIVGRANDLVISGGYNVYPKEVEIELDSLAGVLESAVFGVPHPDFGEGVTAAVVMKPGAAHTEKSILGLLRTRLAGYKMPKQILLVAELPRNAMGKVQKNELRKTYDSIYAQTARPPRA